MLCFSVKSIVSFAIFQAREEECQRAEGRERQDYCDENSWNGHGNHLSYDGAVATLRECGERAMQMRRRRSLVTR